MTARERHLAGADLLAHPISAAVMATIFDRGYAEASVAEFARRAGIANVEFESHFTDKGEATLRVFEAYIDEFVERVGGAYAKVPGWPDNLREAAYETARWILDHPAVTWFGMVGVLEAGDMARARRDQVFRWTASLIDAGRTAAPDPGAVPRSAALMAVGAIAEALRRSQEDGLEINLAATLPRMMYAAVRPYLGEDEARAELTIPLPADLQPRGGA